MQLPSNQIKAYDWLQDKFNDWLDAMPQQINAIHFQQWLTNFITANQMNAQLVVDKFKLHHYPLTKETQKPFLIFVHNMIKNKIDQEHFLFNSYFSQFIVQQIEESVSTQLEWITYCLVAIFNIPYKQSFLAKFHENVEVLDLIFQLLQKTIDDKVFPSVVHNYNPEILDIKNQYSNDQKLGIRLSECDINYIKSSQLSELQKFKFYALITFMGGYNNSVQQLFFPDQFNQAMQQLKIIKDEELISLFLRFIANMVHINKQVWEILKNDVTLLDPVIVYTNSQSLQQIREWATLIVRNLCDCEELREYLLKK